MFYQNCYKDKINITKNLSNSKTNNIRNMIIKNYSIKYKGFIDGIYPFIYLLSRYNKQVKSNVYIN